MMRSQLPPDRKWQTMVELPLSGMGMEAAVAVPPCCLDFGSIAVV